MAPKLYKAADVCAMVQLQPYVLRSWEKEFPGIGVQKTPEGPRLYRQSDVEQVLQIKQLVFGEGLTLAGARRRIEEGTPPDVEVADVLEALASDARARIAHVREGLRSILTLLSRAPGPNGVAGDGPPAPHPAVVAFESRRPSGARPPAPKPSRTAKGSRARA